MRVSVIIPTYNRATVLGRSIQSVLDQTFQDFELIIVDDASQDDTRDVVNNFNIPNIRYVRHEKNLGPGLARNTGINLAQGEYIAFQDSDDQWLPEKLEKQIRYLDSAPSDVGAVYSCLLRMNGSGTVHIPSVKNRRMEGDIHLDICRGNFIAMPVVLVKKECFARTGLFDDRLNQYEDWDMWIRISKYYHFGFIDEPLVISYFTPGSVNEKGVVSEVQAASSILEKHNEEYVENKSVMAYLQFSMGNRLCQTEYIDQGRRYLIKAIKSNPVIPKYSIALFLSLFGHKAYSKIVNTKHGMFDYIKRNNGIRYSHTK